jgi:tRNA (cytidine/uridine-2'-O-)-methyltransferase
MRLALYQPDIPQNAGAMLRLAACLGFGVDIIGPAGFDISDRALRRAALDYLAHVELTRHLDLAAFERCRAASGSRLVVLSRRGKTPYTQAA